MKIEMNPKLVTSNLTLKAIKGLLSRDSDKKQDKNDKADKKVDVAAIAQKLFSHKKAQEAEDKEDETL